MNPMETKRKKNIAFLVVLTGLFISCKSQSEKVVLFDFVPDSLSKEQQQYEAYLDTAHLSIWYMHKMGQNVGDTFFHISLDKKQQMVYVYNFLSAQVRFVSLKQLSKIPIYSIYYHNHDSVFIFYDRPTVYKHKIDTDFVLIDSHGDIMDAYSLNNVPYIYNGTYYNSLYYSDDKMKCRIINGKIIIPFAMFRPQVFHPEKDFKLLPLLALYDLENHTCRMLDITYPKKDEGKCYERRLMPTNVHTDWYGMKKEKLLVSFPYTPNLYLYDITTDSLYSAGGGECVFQNTDSASMKKGMDYDAYYFYMPVWCESSRCYARSIRKYHNGKPEKTLFVQLLDSNLRSLGYLCENDHFYTPYYSNGSWRAKSKDDNLIYEVSLSGKTVICPVDEFMKKYKPAATVLPDGKIPVNVFFANIGIPIKKDNIILIINMNYPCGHCLEYLLGEMRQHQKEYEEHGVYFVLLERAGENYADILLRQYGLESAANVMVDRRHYPSVLLNGKGIDDEYYRFFRITDRGAAVRLSTATKMPSDFKELIKNEVFNSKTNNND